MVSALALVPCSGSRPVPGPSPFRRFRRLAKVVASAARTPPAAWFPSTPILARLLDQLRRKSPGFSKTSFQAVFAPFSRFSPCFSLHFYNRRCSSGDEDVLQSASPFTFGDTFQESRSHKHRGMSPYSNGSMFSIVVIVAVILRDSRPSSGRSWSSCPRPARRCCSRRRCRGYLPTSPKRGSARPRFVPSSLCVFRIIVSFANALCFRHSDAFGFRSSYTLSFSDHSIGCRDQDIADPGKSSAGDSPRSEARCLFASDAHNHRTRRSNARFRLLSASCRVLASDACRGWIRIDSYLRLVALDVLGFGFGWLSWGSLKAPILMLSFATTSW